jgi:hypothetical protein
MPKEPKDTFPCRIVVECYNKRQLDKVLGFLCPNDIEHTVEYGGDLNG